MSCRQRFRLTPAEARRSRAVRATGGCSALSRILPSMRLLMTGARGRAAKTAKVSRYTLPPGAGREVQLERADAELDDQDDQQHEPRRVRARRAGQRRGPIMSTARRRRGRPGRGRRCLGRRSARASRASRGGRSVGCGPRHSAAGRGRCVRAGASFSIAARTRGRLAEGVEPMMVWSIWSRAACSPAISPWTTAACSIS